MLSVTSPFLRNLLGGRRSKHVTPHQHQLQPRFLRPTVAVPLPDADHVPPSFVSAAPVTFTAADKQMK